MKYPTLLNTYTVGSFTTFLIALLLGVACVPDTPPGYSFSVKTEEGVRVAITSGGPRYAGELFEYEPFLTLNEDPGSEESMLYRPGLFTVDADGYFYVTDSGNYRIAVFNPEGEFVRSFGRMGNGPGEFRSVRLQYVHDSVVSCFDSRLDRTTLFQTDGTLLEVVTMTYYGLSLSDLFRAPGGERIAVSHFDDRRGDGYYRTANRVHVMSAAGDSLAKIETELIIEGYTFDFRGMPEAGIMRMEYQGSPCVLYLPDRGLLLTTGKEPLLMWYDLNGTLVEEIRLDQEPEPVSESERRAIRQRAADELAGAPPGNREVTKASTDALKIPSHKAFWNDVTVDNTGYYWLQIPETYRQMGEAGGPLFRVLSPEGEYLGNSRWPRTSGSVASGCFLAYVTDEETGARTPMVFKITPVHEGLRFP